jgi:hypothetical protein
MDERGGLQGMVGSFQPKAIFSHAVELFINQRDEFRSGILIAAGHLLEEKCYVYRLGLHADLSVLVHAGNLHQFYSFSLLPVNSAIVEWAPFGPENPKTSRLPA